MKNLLPIMVLITLAISGCSTHQTTSFSSANSNNNTEISENVDTPETEVKQQRFADQTVLIMPLDVELFLLTASGIPQPRADCSKTAKEHISIELEKALISRFENVLTYEQNNDNIDNKKNHPTS